MSFDLAQTFDILRRTPGVLDCLLRESSPDWHNMNEGDETWSAFDIVGHLVYGEQADWVPRARIILEHGDSQPFEPFDRFAQDQLFDGWSLHQLLERFAELRQANLATVQGWQLTDEQLALPGRHPALGAVTLQQLLATWAVHDLNHLAQMSRVMAGRYLHEVGAWHEYLTILPR